MTTSNQSMDDASSGDDIPRQIFAEFVNELKKSNFPEDVVEAFEDLFSSKKSINQASINAALFPPDKSIT